MDEQLVLDIVRRIICEENEDIHKEDILMTANFEDDLDVDSLTRMTVLSSLEDEFEIEIPDDQIDNFNTVGDLVYYLMETKH